MKPVFAALVALVAANVGLAIELETFALKGNPRTFGVDLSIGRPKGWVDRIGVSTSAVAAFWKAPRGLADSMSLVFPRTKPGNEWVSREDFRDTFENPQLAEMIGRSLLSAKFLRKVFLDDFKYPAGFLEYTAKYRLPTSEADVRIRTYLVYLGSVMVQIQFYLVQDGAADRLKEFDAEMQQIIESLVWLKP